MNKGGDSVSWLQHLYQTFENNSHQVGEFHYRNDQEYVLIPVSHTMQEAHIEINLDMEGNFLTAKVIDKEDSKTIIPCTEASAVRSGTMPPPHPLHDKLMYVAGDFSKFSTKTLKYDPYAEYIEQLKNWCNSPFAHEKVKSVFKYVQKGTLVEDLIKEKILYVDENNRLIEKWNNAIAEKYGEKPKIFNVIPSNQSDAFVRFAVHKIGDPESRLWRDKTVFESFINYYEKILSNTDVCYITGEKLPITEKHASKIRFSSDMAKLISANDSQGFTYRGRFEKSNEAFSVSYQVSQKAHNALKWLIAKQGYSIDGRVFLVWGTQKTEMPNPHLDTDDLFSFLGQDVQISGDETHQEFASRIHQAINGYKQDLDYHSKVIIMVLDAATTGRMAIVYYRDMDQQLFFDRIEAWHQSCYWIHHYKRKNEEPFLGAPSTNDIAFAVYGEKADNAIKKELLERLLPSIIDGRKIPIDIVRKAVQRASNPVSMENEREWKKTLSIACALVRKWYEKEEYDVALDVNNRNRDYLFGRLLAIADVLERSVLDRNEPRATNAIRYMNVFAQRPLRTWNIIQSNIQPYQAKFGTRLNYYNRLIDEVGSLFRPEDFNDKPLTGLYLLGFYSQRYELYKGNKEKEQE